MIQRWRTHTTFIVIVGLVLILIALVASYMSQNLRPSTELRLGSGVFSVQVAQTNDALVQGLSGTESLAANEGLLMVFPVGDTWGIWMKDMLIPLDIVWMDKDKKVVHIVTDASPDLGTSKTFRPEDPALYVLEVPAGTVKQSGIAIGSVAVFDIVEGK